MNKYIVIILLTLWPLAGCEDLLDEKVYSELTPDILNTEDGTLSVLYSSYSNAQLIAFNGGVQRYFLSTMTSGEGWSEGGDINSILTPQMNFTWDSDLPHLTTVWNFPYASIRDANILIGNLGEASLPNEFKSLIIAEAKFLRGFSYSQLYNWFGPTPLVTPETEELRLARASEEEMKAFIEQDLLDAAEQLPLVQDEYGRATKGSALGVLCKFYLNTKQWEKCANVAQQIIDLNQYGLVADYADVFSLENEGNAEMLWVLPNTAQGASQFINALTFPTDYPLLPNQGVYAATTYLFDDFVNSFEEGDTRKNLIVTAYTNTSGQQITLLGNDQSLSLKYEFDPEASGPGMGNDMPEVRYADILLSLAEALNELNGPDEEIIQLINLVRDRAGVSLISLNGFTKESLREEIFKEREWEFFTEAKRREDQIRQGTFILKAQARGKNAQPFHVRFPIPQTEMNANPNLEQNEGY